MAFSRRQKQILIPIGLIIAAALVITIMLAIRDGGKPLEKPKSIAFVHMLKANVITIGQPAREGVIFVLPGSKNFCGPSKGPRGEDIFVPAVPDDKLEKNHFIVIKKTSPRIFTQGQDFQSAYDYVEIHYHVDHIESQDLPYPTVICSNF